MRDIGGDGRPDIIVADGGKQLIVVYRNLTGRTNMLRSVTLPFGGHISIGYEQTTPQFKSLYKKLERNNAEYQSH